MAARRWMRAANGSWSIPIPTCCPRMCCSKRRVASGDIAGTLTGLNPVSPDYARLKEELARTTDPAKRKLIRANMDRWRWLARDLGKQYLLTNVPEYQLRLTVNDRIIKNYRVVVGKPGRTATPAARRNGRGGDFQSDLDGAAVDREGRRAGRQGAQQSRLGRGPMATRRPREPMVGSPWSSSRGRATRSA